MNGRQVLIFFVFSLLLAPVIAQGAQSYEINPAKWVFYQKDDYELKPIFFNFEIKNTNTGANGTITISLKTIPPEYLYSDQYPGIVAFPDYSWITIAETKVTIPPNSTVEVPVHVNIPEQYFVNSSSTAISNYNKTYEAWFLADQTAGPGNIQTDYRCRWVFITPVKYVAPWQRPGALFPYPPEFLYAIILIVIVLIIAIFIFLRRRGRGRKKKEQQEEEPVPRIRDDVWQQ